MKSSVRRMRFLDWGGYSKSAWLQEADGQLASSRLLRQIWRRRRKSFSQHMKRRDESGVDYALGIVAPQMEATAKSSILLLGYALEVYLKAGLVPVYSGCPKPLFARDLRKKFSHKLILLAKEIEFSISKEEERILKFMQEAVLGSARYPLLAFDELSHMRDWNTLTHEIWDDVQYKKTVELAKRIRKHASLIDQDSSNPASTADFKIDGDGYFVFRCGGRLSPRITVKYSSKQKSAGKNNPTALRKLIVSHSGHPLIDHYWNAAVLNAVEI